MALQIKENVVAHHIALRLSDAIHISKKILTKIVIQDGFLLDKYKMV